MYTLKNHKGFTAIEGIFAAVALIAIAAAGYFAYQEHQDKTDYTVSIAHRTSDEPQSIDPYKGWKTYTMKYYQVSFKYPSGWKVESDTTIADDSNYKMESTRIKSPGGYIAEFETAEGLGGACPDGIPFVSVVESSKLAYNDKSGNAVYYVEKSREGGSGRQRFTGLTADTELGEASIKSKKVCLDYLAFTPKLTSGVINKDDTLITSASFEDEESKAKLTDKEYFDLPDVKAGKLLFESVTN